MALMAHSVKIMNLTAIKVQYTVSDSDEVQLNRISKHYKAAQPKKD